MSSWVGNPGRLPYMIPRGSAGLTKKNNKVQLTVSKCSGWKACILISQFSVNPDQGRMRLTSDSWLRYILRMLIGLAVDKHLVLFRQPVTGHSARMFNLSSWVHWVQKVCCFWTSFFRLISQSYFQTTIELFRIITDGGGGIGTGSILVSLQLNYTTCAIIVLPELLSEGDLLLVEIVRVVVLSASRYFSSRVNTVTDWINAASKASS